MVHLKFLGFVEHSFNDFVFRCEVNKDNFLTEAAVRIFNYFFIIFASNYDIDYLGHDLE